MKMRSVIFVVAMLWGGTSAFSEQSAPSPSITVVGSGEVTAKPDTAEIRAGVVTQAESASEALKANNAAMDKLLKTLQSQGIAEKDIQTSTFQIRAEYERSPDGNRGNKIVGYRVTNQVGVKIRKIESLGTVLDETVRAGGNEVHGISFSVDDPTRLLDEAREKSMADARRKAELYAKAADVKLGRAMTIHEQTSPTPQPRMLGLAARAETASAVPVATGEQEFRAGVTVTYSVE